ncbi:hypothetical protein [Methylorubrum populi]|uniref:hypothetical protein n=1 Tax=Methylorubrum populi TaxID=223967 RepID=UPI0012FFC909|nr:hypothetical protein [Methylorubrum populi]
MAKSNRLRELADVLGVPVNAFWASKECYQLHVDADGTRWLLTLDAQGRPIVRRIGADADQNTIEESASQFLRRDRETPQRDALIALIDLLLTAHLKNS